MLRYREIIELRSIGLSLEKVAYLCGCNEAKVATQLGLGWPVPIELAKRSYAG